jgi:pilus assembly protein CpaE
VSESGVIAVGAPPTFRYQVARALTVEPEAVDWVPTVPAAEWSLSQSEQRFDVIVLSPAIKDADAFGMAEFVGRTTPASAVVLVRDTAPNGLMPRAMRAGIRDVVDLSQGGEELREALHKAVAWTQSLQGTGGKSAVEGADRKATVVSVFSSKGGTGKTFLTANLAAGLALQTQQDAAVLDLELAVGDVFAYFGKTPGRPLQDVMGLGDAPPRESVMAAGTPLAERIWGYGSPSDPAAEAITGQAIGQVIRVLRTTFDHLVIDGSADYSDAALAAFDLSEAVLLVASLDVVSIRHLSIALQTLLTLGLPRDRFRVILNRSDSKVGISPGDVERVTKIKVDALIPSSRLVPISLNAGHPVILQEPKSEISKSLMGLTEMFAKSPNGQAAKRRLFRKS